MALVVGENSYIDYAGAENYMSERLYVAAWDGAGQQTCEKALIMATRKIECLPVAGAKTNKLQKLQFPRNRDIAIPDNVKFAVCEEALAILAGGANGDSRAKLQAAGVQDFTIGSLSETFKPGANGINLLSPEAVRLMEPYMGGIEID